MDKRFSLFLSSYSCVVMYRHSYICVDRLVLSCRDDRRSICHYNQTLCCDVYLRPIKFVLMCLICVAGRFKGPCVTSVHTLVLRFVSPVFNSCVDMFVFLCCRQERAFARYCRARAWVASRWTWLQAQIADLEYRILQQHKIYS